MYCVCRVGVCEGMNEVMLIWLAGVPLAGCVCVVAQAL